MATSVHYDSIGRDYGARRRADPRISAQLLAALGGANTVLNVGAGTGSYEPNDRAVFALDLSRVMLDQRPAGAPPAIQARAEALPFRERTFDAVLGVLTSHHWTDPRAGLAECVRVSRQRVVLLTFDPDASGFWLTRDYLPEFADLDRQQFLPMNAYAELLGDRVRVQTAAVGIPHDCVDGFLGAYWARPAAYLDPVVQACISSFSRVPTAAGLARLRADLDSGRWVERYGDLLERKVLDVGYRIITAHVLDAADEGFAFSP